MIPSVSTLLLAATLAASTALAQTAPEPTHAPDGSTQTFVPGIDVLPFPNLPFSGSETIVRVRPLPDGGTITSTLTAKVIRDSQGRLYRERHHFTGGDVDPQKTLYEFTIYDPVAHTRTTCTVPTHRCAVGPYRPRLTLVERPAGPFDNGRRLLSRDSLGQKTIEDLNTLGTRETETIAPGTLGNDKQLTLTRELWYSPDLKTNLQVIRNDPRDGTVTINLNIQSRSDPDPSAFAIPPGYIVQPPHPAPVSAQ